MPTIDAPATGTGQAYPPTLASVLAIPAATGTGLALTPSLTSAQAIPVAVGFGWAPAPLFGDAALVAARGVVLAGLAGPSSDQWVTFDLLDQDDAKIGAFGVGEIPPVSSCRWEWAAGAVVHGYGECVVDGAVPLGWRIRPMRHVRVDGVEAVFPRGIFVMRPRSPSYTSAGEIVTVCDLMDKTDVVVATSISQDLTLPRGKIVVGDAISNPGEVLYQIGMSGEYDAADFDAIANYETLRAPLNFESGASRLSIANKVLAAINYWALDVDAEGRFRVRPYQSPQARYHPASAWHLADGENCTYLGTVSVTREIDTVNKLTVVARGGDVDLDAYTAFNYSGECGPYANSYAARGRWVAPRDGAIAVEATSSAQLAAIGQRMLRARQAPAATVKLSMDWWPIVGNSVGTFTRHPWYVDALAVVTHIAESADASATLEVTLELVS